MFIEGDSVVHGDSARIMSPVCHTSGKQCLGFWFHMYGLATAMSLNLYIFENNRASKIWSRTNNQGNSWYQGQVEIKPQQPFQVSYYMCTLQVQCVDVNEFRGQNIKCSRQT